MLSVTGAVATRARCGAAFRARPTSAWQALDPAVGFDCRNSRRRARAAPVGAFPPFAPFPQLVCLSRGVQSGALRAGSCVSAICAIRAAGSSRPRGVVGRVPRWSARSRHLRHLRSRFVSIARCSRASTAVVRAFPPFAQFPLPVCLSRGVQLGASCAGPRVCAIPAVGLSHPRGLIQSDFPHFSASPSRRRAAGIGLVFQGFTNFRIFRNFRSGCAARPSRLPLPVRQVGGRDKKVAEGALQTFPNRISAIAAIAAGDSRTRSPIESRRRSWTRRHTAVGGMPILGR